MENLLGIDIQVLNDDDEAVAYAAFTVTAKITTLELYPSLVISDTDDFTDTVPSVVTYTAGVVSASEPLDASHPFADPDVLIVSDEFYGDALSHVWANSENIRLLTPQMLRTLPYAVGQRVSGSFGFGTVTVIGADSVVVVGDNGQSYTVSELDLTLV